MLVAFVMLVTSTSLSWPLIAMVDWAPGATVILPFGETFRFSPACTMARAGFVKLPFSSILAFIWEHRWPGAPTLIMPFAATLRFVLLDELSVRVGRSASPPFMLVWRDLSRFMSTLTHDGAPVEFEVMLKLPNIFRLLFGMKMLTAEPLTTADRLETFNTSSL